MLCFNFTYTVSQLFVVNEVVFFFSQVYFRLLKQSDYNLIMYFLIAYTYIAGPFNSGTASLCSCALRFFVRQNTHRATQECLAKAGRLLSDRVWYSAGTRSQCSPQQWDKWSRGAAAQTPPKPGRKWPSRTLWVMSLKH